MTIKLKKWFLGTATVAFLALPIVSSINTKPAKAEADAITALAEFLKEEGVFDYVFHSGPNQCRSLERYNRTINHINNANTEYGAKALRNFIGASSMQRNCVNSIYRGNLGALENRLGKAIEEYQNPAFQATIKVRNTSNKTIFAAINWKKNGRWQTEGWWKLRPGQTKQVGITKNRYVYFHAESEGANSVFWGNGDRKYCTKSSKFILTGNNTCSSNRLRKFSEGYINFQGSGTYTYTFR